LKDIFWIGGDPPPGLAIVLRPRGDDWLEDELARARRAGIDTLVSLLEDGEAAELGLASESEVATENGLSFASFPIPDRHVPPDVTSFRSLVAGLANQLAVGEHVGVHCRGSIGRATMTAACTLIHLGWTPKEALTAIEFARGCPVPDTPEQREWILRYEAKP
jgi:protein-tyrosine phosphatase